MDDICPHLGFIKDPKTCARYANHGNACHHVSPPQTVNLDYQRNVCLTAEHLQCNGYTQDWKEGFPQKIKNEYIKRKHKKIRFVWVFGMGFLSMLLIFGFILALRNLGPAPIATIEGGIKPLILMHTKTIVNTTASTSTASQPTSKNKTSTPTLQPPHTATPETKPTTTPGPGLLTPIVVDEYEFIVYQVLEGDSLLLLANRYNTTVEVLETINDFTTRPLWPGDNIVLCVGCNDASDLPKLQAFYFEHDMSLSEIAEQYDVIPEELRHWNNLGRDEVIEGDRWIIIPLF